MYPRVPGDVPAPAGGMVETKLKGGLLVRAAEGAYAVGTGIVADYPKASREFGGRQRRHVAGPALNVLLPAGFQCGNTGTLRRYHSVGVVQYRIAGAKPNGCGVVGQRSQILVIVSQINGEAGAA